MNRAVAAIIFGLLIAACSNSADSEVRKLEARIAQLEEEQADTGEQIRNLEQRSIIASGERETLFEGNFRQNRLIEALTPHSTESHQWRIDELERKVEKLCRNGYLGVCG